MSSWYQEKARAMSKARMTRASNVRSSREELIAEYERLGYTVVWKSNADPFVYMPGTDPKTATRRIRLQDRTVRREVRGSSGWTKVGSPIAHKVTLLALKNL